MPLGQRTGCTCIAANFTPAASKEGINVGSLMRRVKKKEAAPSAVLEDTESAQAM